MAASICLVRKFCQMYCTRQKRYFCRFSRVYFFTNANIFNQTQRVTYGGAAFIRCYSVKQPEDRVQPPIRPRRYALDRLISFITDSADKLEKRIPSVFKVYRTFKTGISSFVTDCKNYYKVSYRLWSGESLQEFSRKELELYRQFGSDLPLVGFMVLVAFAPGGAIVFPIAYTFPRFLLSHHFWTPQQKQEFQRIALTKQMRHYESILDYLHLLSQHIEDDKIKENMRKVISKLDTQVVLDTSEILQIFHLFEDKPYSMDCISIRHMRHLGKALGLSVWHKRLVQDAQLLHYIDEAMVKEGIHLMADEELDKACAWRGLNPQGLRRKDKISYLESWTLVSSFIRRPSISLLLHLPVLLGYCLPSNRELMVPRTHSRGHL